MTMFSLPGSASLLLLLPLLFPIFRRFFARREKAILFELLPILAYFVLLLLALVFHSRCSVCHHLPPVGLFLSLAFTAALLCYLPALPEEGRRSPAPILLPSILTLSSGVFLQNGTSNIYLGGGILAGALCLSALLLGGAYPGGYLRMFPFRLLLSSVVSSVLFLFSSRLSPQVIILLVLSAVLLVLPSPFPRRSEKILHSGFLRVDQALFVCLPPLLSYHLFRGLPQETAYVFWPLLLSLMIALSGLLFAKTALFVEELADGLTVAGTGFLACGFLTFQQEGKDGALFLALVIPLATALSGLSLSFLSQRFRTRTFQGLTGKGTVVGPMRLGFLFGAFQGMSLPLVGGLLGEWVLLKALADLSVTFSILAVGGIFLTFVLVLGRTRILFSGKSDSRLSLSDQDLASEILPNEAWALGLAFFFLLGVDILGSLGLMGGW